MKVLVFNVLLAYAALSCIIAKAQTPDEQRTDLCSSSEALIRYYESNIFPTLMEARAIFDKSLDKQEQKVIERIRTEAEIKNRKLSINKVLIDRVRDILNVHQRELKAIQKEMTPYYKKWKGEINSLVASQSQQEYAYKVSLSPLHFLLLDMQEMKTEALLEMYFIKC